MSSHFSTLGSQHPGKSLAGFLWAPTLLTDDARIKRALGPRLPACSLVQFAPTEQVLPFVLCSCFLIVYHTVFPGCRVRAGRGLVPLTRAPLCAGSQGVNTIKVHDEKGTGTRSERCVHDEKTREHKTRTQTAPTNTRANRGPSAPLMRASTHPTAPPLRRPQQILKKNRGIALITLPVVYLWAPFILHCVLVRASTRNRDAWCWVGAPGAHMVFIMGNGLWRSE